MRLTALALLPALTFIALFLTLRARARDGDARLALLRTGLLTGAYAILATEILSLLDAINRMGLVLAWAAPASLLAIGLVRRPPPWRALLPRLPPERTDRALLLAAIIPLMASAVVAWKAPPQTWDSLNYHMPRVAHWAQNRSLRPFATGIEIQNSRPPGAEILILQTYVLSQGDRWANLVAWLAVAGGVMGASLLARQLGARRRGQILAATVAATIPMALVQASSTMNDALVAFWMVCLANEALALPGRDFRTPALYAALAAGLAIATKPTALAYVLPFALYVTWSLLRLRGGKRLLPLALAALGLALLPNAGSWARNLSLYGSPINPEQAAVHSNALADPRALVSNVLRNASLHASTPWPHVNKGITLVVRAVHHWMGLDINDPRTTAHTKFRVRPLSTHEDLTGNTLHALLILISLVVIVACRRSLGTKVLTHTALVTATFLDSELALQMAGLWQPLPLALFPALRSLDRPDLGIAGARALGAAPGTGPACGQLALAAFHQLPPTDPPGGHFLRGQRAGGAPPKALFRQRPLPGAPLPGDDRAHHGGRLPAGGADACGQRGRISPLGAAGRAG